MNTTLEYIVKKFDIDLKKDQPIQIPSIGRQGLVELFAELDFCEGAEIGVDRGIFSERLCKANPNLCLFSIDSWSTSSFEDPLNTSPAIQKQFDRHYQDAQRRLANCNCQIIRKESLDAVKDFADNTLDFVYIDANHSFVHVASDLYRWEKKVRIGGIISGHDYVHFPPAKDNHVKHIVDAYVQAFEIKPYFELGQDRFHSWFWIKLK
jgi:hypothetical protein